VCCRVVKSSGRLSTRIPLAGPWSPHRSMTALPPGVAKAVIRGRSPVSGSSLGRLWVVSGSSLGLRRLWVVSGSFVAPGIAGAAGARIDGRGQGPGTDVRHGTNAAQRTAQRTAQATASAARTLSRRGRRSGLPANAPERARRGRAPGRNRGSVSRSPTCSRSSRTCSRHRRES
jgi:hypothetical protein